MKVPLRHRGFAVVALVVLAACGGAGTDAVVDDAVAGQLAGDSFAARFDAVTDGFRQRSISLQQRADELGDGDAAVIEVYAELREIAADARQQYGEIAAPTPVQAVHTRILQLFDRQVALLEDLLEAARAGQTNEVGIAAQGLVDLENDFATARNEMQAAMAACGTACFT